MNKYTYEIKSKTIIEGEEAGEFYKISALSSDEGKVIPKEIFISLDGKWEIGSLVELKISRVDYDFKGGGFNFLHHYDRPNQGDLYSGPYHYFDFNEYKKVSWDEYIVNNKSSDFNVGGITVIGGGIYFTTNKPRLKNLMIKSRHFVAWGIGLDPRSNVSEFLGLCSLVGTRERKSSFVDNVKVFYVPCVSCMNPVFDSGKESFEDDMNDIVLHLNGGFNEKELIGKFPGAPITTTVSKFEDIIKNIRSAKCVVTNSYHGAYWGSLLGKKVVCLKTKVPKWDGLHENIAFSDVDDLEVNIKTANKIPYEYLVECRSINEEFYKKVMNLNSAS